MLKCAFLCADNDDDDVKMHVDAFNINHAASRSLLRAPQLHHITPIKRTPESCVSIHFCSCCVQLSTVLLTADASTWLAAIVRGDYAGITKRSCSTHPTETSAFQYGLCEDTPPLCWRATLQHTGTGQPCLARSFSRIFMHAHEQLFLSCVRKSTFNRFFFLN